MIRPLGPRDVDSFMLIRADMLRRSPLSFGSDPDQHIDRDQTYRDLKEKNEENFILGYFDDNNTLVGMIGCFRKTRKKERHKAYMWGMYVHEVHRGKGIARQLMEEALDKIKQAPGVEKVMLSVTTSAKAAKTLYESFGFKPYGIEEDAYRWDGQVLDEVFMELAV